MLIRICDHFRDNPKRIDKLIAIKGLPDEWLFTDGPAGKELRKPWEPDIDVNIPRDIRHLCEPLYITLRYAPIERGAKEVIERRQIMGIKIDFNSEPGRDMWERVERYIEESIPRNERIPKPVLCAKDERSPFETYTTRRNQNKSLVLEPSEIPEIDLRIYIPKVADTLVPPVLAPELTVPTPTTLPPIAQALQPVQVPILKCDQCDFTHVRKNGIRMHTMKKHPMKVPEKAVA